MMERGPLIWGRNPNRLKRRCGVRNSVSVRVTKEFAKLCDKERNRDEGRKRRNDGATDPVAKEVPDLASCARL